MTGQEPMARVLEIMARLRDPEHGCPWDLKQRMDTLVPHTLEEAYEVADAVQRGDMEDLRAELGDLLLQVVFYARLAQEQEAFDFADVAATLAEKLVRRHPHIFAGERFDSEAEQHAAWEAEKARERAARRGQAQDPPGLLDGVAHALPALTRAAKLQKRAARAGFDWDAPGPVLDKIREELDEVGTEMAAGAAHDRLEDEVGDLLFAVANLARHLAVDPEAALRRGNAKFERRFRYMEAALARAGQRPEDQSLEALEGLWQEAKRAGA
ncbi:nucleoside triphosphate pyrophosphohydrolase [Ectothiorhodospira mobilis]|uniref:nucleoside triphosphate pyrophosphohydrolase n=1 Tax=Ectothiorhodospira mobilis TaxID=195064 RepID=UPI001EE87241|nr:nucleoside triphosphate pyrophosphohydrolase [Ectothiorhodospira mobilis]MCG5536306.1 nucleoside triphosphate pyrophosphohydrolase [Ectothiorhodospira mobilis]